MRTQLCEALVARSSRSDMVFLTGDLGFMALEPLQKAMGRRFINAGVAEQNMVSVGAAMARQGLEVWVYSIAPFVYARPFEQIRNDIAFHRLPVKLIGNGGGYGYGVMGPTHHAIDDYGALLALPDMAVYVPVFNEDIPGVIEAAGNDSRPSYIRIGRGELPKDMIAPRYQAWRQLTEGGGPVVAAVGPLAGTYLRGIANMPADIRPSLWAIAELPLDSDSVPEPFLKQIEDGKALCVAEEHVAHGSFGAGLLQYLAGRGIAICRFRHLYATSHNFGRYGSQDFMRIKAGLDFKSLQSILESL